MNQITAKRSLGQNFFSNKNLAYKICDIITESNPRSIIEIGPGTGVFTHLLSKRSHVTAIEKDDYLYEMLSGYVDNTRVDLIHSDVRTLKKDRFLKISDIKEAVIFGSLPYNQSKQIISTMLRMNITSDHYYIIQKEVAQKYSDTEKMNRLSAFAGIYSSSKIRLLIKPESFRPKPKVVSALIHFKAYEKPLLEEHMIEGYTRFLNLIFANRRKKIHNNLSGLQNSSAVSETITSKRAENLTMEEVITLYRQLSS